MARQADVLSFFSLCSILLYLSVTTAWAGLIIRPPVLQEERLSAIDAIADKAVREGNTPGAVVIIGNHGRIVYRKAFGYRALQPKKIPMTEDTIFDLASLTKTVATTTAIMQLSEQGKLNIEAPVSKYWPAFGANGKKDITVRHLLTHYSGLLPGLKFRPRWSGYRTAMKKIIAEKPVLPPGSCFMYSDINFEILGELVRLVSGKPLDVYSAENIFDPLGMKDTGFNPPADLKKRIAPTQYRARKMIYGEPHDPFCYIMGGVAGHAGLFSTADDLSLFAQMLLSGGSGNGVRIIKPATIEEMSLPQPPSNGKTLRGFGWDIEAPFASNRDDLFQSGAYGHLGYTGTALWIDPVTQTYIIILTNRVHPDGKGNVKELRARIKKTVSDALGPLMGGQVLSYGYRAQTLPPKMLN